MLCRAFCNKQTPGSVSCLQGLSVSPPIPEAWLSPEKQKGRFCADRDCSSVQHGPHLKLSSASPATAPGATPITVIIMPATFVILIATRKLLSTYYLLGTIPVVFHVLLKLLTTQRGRYFYHRSHFTHEKTETLRSQSTFRVSHSEDTVGQAFKPGQSEATAQGHAALCVSEKEGGAHAGDVCGSVF